MSDEYVDVVGARWFDERAQLALRSEDDQYMLMHFDEQPGQDLVAGAIKAVYTEGEDAYADTVDAYMDAGGADIGDLRVGVHEQDFGGGESDQFYDPSIEIDGEDQDVEVSIGLLLASIGDGDVAVSDELLLDEEVLQYGTDTAWEFVTPSQRKLDTEFTGLDAVSYERAESGIEGDYERLMATGMEESTTQVQMMGGGGMEVQEVDTARVTFDTEENGQYAWDVHPETSELLYKEFLDRTGQEGRFQDGALDELTRVSPFSVFEELDADAELYGDVIVQPDPGSEADPMQVQRFVVETGDSVVEAPVRLLYHIVPGSEQEFNGMQVQQQDAGQVQQEVQNIGADRQDLNSTGKGMFQ